MGTQTFTDSLTQVPAHCDGRCTAQVRATAEVPAQVPAPKRQCAMVPWQQIEVESVTGSTLFHLVNMPLCLGWRGVLSHIDLERIRYLSTSSMVLILEIDVVIQSSGVFYG